MIAIDIIRKKRASGTTGGSTAGTGMATAAGGSTDRANEADHAQRADNATHADTAKELDGDSTVWATIRSWIANVGESVKDMFLRKDVDDETTHKLTMNAAEVKDALTVDGNGTVKKNLGVGGNSTVGGHVTTDDARSSDSGGKAAMSGQGWTLKNTTDAGDDYSILAVDDLIVRRKMEVAELEINKKTYVGGQLVVSDWGHKIWMLQPVQMKVDDNGAYLPGQYVPQAQGTEGMTKVTIVGDGTTADKEVTVEMMGDGGKFPDSAYFENVDAVKVWFCESDGTVSIKDDLTVGSMGMVQEFNVETGTTENATNTYYWGTCMEHGLETVRTDGKETKCIYAVFGVLGGIYALKSEAKVGHTFKAYASAANSTPPSAGDDMVGFGNADPYQDSARSDVVVIASKDADGFAPGLVSYRGIGRLRGGVVDGAGNYTKRSEQYSLPSTVDDERLDARISRNAGNVFKGSVYFTGSDGKTPLKAKYMLDVSPSAVQAGGTVKWKVMKYLNGQLSEVNMGWDTSENWTRWDVMVSGSGVGESVPVSDGSYTFASTCAGGYTLALGNHGTGETADTTTVSVLKEQEIPETPDIPDQTVVWKLVPLVEVAEAGYTIDPDAYADYTGGSSGDEAKLVAVFKKTTNISLQYKVVKLYGDGMTEEFESNAGGNNIHFTAYDKDDKQVGAIEGGMAFKSTDTDIAYVKVDLNYGESKTYDKRIVRVKLSNNGVMAATKDMLAYTYYGTDGETGISYVNRHLSTMEGNVSTVRKKVGEEYSTIKQTAEEISLKVGKCATRQELLDTGIDMSAGEITLTADKTTLQTNSGKKILSTMMDADGNWTNVKVDADALTINADQVNVSATHQLRISGNGAMVVDMDNFKLDESGNASFKGSIDSKSGTISFFTFTDSGMYSASSSSGWGLGLRSTNISVRGTPGGRPSLVCLGDGHKDTTGGDADTYPTSLVNGQNVNYCNLIQVTGGGTGNGRDAAALGIETDGDFCLSAMGGLSHLQGLALDASTTSGSANRTLFLCSGGSFTMPSNPKDGQLVIVIQTTSTSIKFYGNGAKFAKGTARSLTCTSGSAGQWNFFVYVSANNVWRCVYANGGLF